MEYIYSMDLLPQDVFRGLGHSHGRVGGVRRLSSLISNLLSLKLTKTHVTDSLGLLVVGHVCLLGRAISAEDLPAVPAVMLAVGQCKL